MTYIKCNGKTYTVEEVIEIIRDYEKRKAEQEARTAQEGKK